MSQSKQDQLTTEISSEGVDFTDEILFPEVIENAIGGQIPLNQDILSVYTTSKKLMGIFQLRMDLWKALVCVVEGDVGTLITLVRKNPGVLFQKGQVRAPRGQTYDNVSPYQLITFLCDDDMKAQIMPLIPADLNLTKIRKAQYAEIDSGGADLVKLDFDPLLITYTEFKNITEFKTQVNVFGTSTDITFSLLENPDGILYWKDANGEVNFYYANCQTETVIPLVPEVISPEEQEALNQFKRSFDAMEKNSSRRSTDKEHQLITILMQRTLHRKGIRYTWNGESYCDSRTQFQLINNYRTCIRLYEEAGNDADKWYKADIYWREGVGKAQGEEMWLLERLCEKDRPFYPLPLNFKDFKRGFAFYNWDTSLDEAAFTLGKLVVGLGSDFSLYKGPGGRPACLRAPRAAAGPRLVLDLFAVCRLVEDAKANIIESGRELEPNFQTSNTPQH